MLVHPTMNLNAKCFSSWATLQPSNCFPECQDRDSNASGSRLEMPPIERHYRFGV
jgi:hypothetical protein